MFMLWPCCVFNKFYLFLFTIWKSMKWNWNSSIWLYKKTSKKNVRSNCPSGLIQWKFNETNSEIYGPCLDMYVLVTYTRLYPKTFSIQTEGFSVVYIYRFVVFFFFFFSCITFHIRDWSKNTILYRKEDVCLHYPNL